MKIERAGLYWAGFRWARVLVAGAAIWLLVGPSPAHATAGNPTLTIQPGTLQLVDEASVTVILSNPGAVELTDVKLSAASDPAVKAVVAASDVGRIPAGDEHAWTVAVSGTEISVLPAKVYMRASFNRAEEGKPVTRAYALATLEVIDATRGAVPDPATLTVHGTPGSVDQFNDGIVILTMKNKSPAPINVENVRWITPEFLEVTWSNQRTSLVVNPGATGVFRFEVTAAQRVAPGKQPISFLIDVTAETSGRESTVRLAATHEVEVGVYGISAILTALAVPAFLFLPGFLIVASFMFARYGKTWPLTLTSAPFYMFSISFSLGTVFVYPWLLGVLDQPVPTGILINTYGFLDVVWVWFGSIALGLLAGAAWQVGVFANGWQRRRKTPEPWDGPIKVLKKLHRQGLTPNAVSVKVEGDTATYFLLQRQPDDPEREVWIGPRILVTWKGSADEMKACRTAVEKHIASNAKRVAEQLETAQSKQWVHVAWETTNTIARPTAVKSKTCKTVETLQTFVENKR